MKRTRLERKRKDKGLTQGEVAKRAGIHRGYYTNIENGKRRCSVNTWLKIANCLGIPEEDIVSYIKEGLQEGT